MMSIFLLFMGLFVNAPLEELANGNVTPVVAKAPWYFVGLQELLAYFHPTVAGVLAPTVILVGRGARPLRRPRAERRWRLARPSDRKVGVLLFSCLGPDCRSPSWARSSAARDMAGPCRGRASSSPSRVAGEDDRGELIDGQLEAHALAEPTALTTEVLRELRRAAGRVCHGAS